jgi:phage tail sheath protein FI
MFFPRIIAKDRLSAKLAEFAPSAAAAALIVRDDRGSEGLLDASGPALLRPSAMPAMPVDDTQRARLARWGVNVLAATRTPGQLAPPLRTLAGEHSAPLAMRLVSERRLALFVGSSLERGTRWVAMEGNNNRSRERVARQAERFLSQLAAAGAFAGSEMNRHYFVICDERVNGVAEELAGEFRVAFGFRSRNGANRQSWLIVHRAVGSEMRPVSLNALAASELL